MNQIATAVPVANENAGKEGYDLIGNPLQAEKIKEEIIQEPKLKELHPEVESYARIAINELENEFGITVRAYRTKTTDGGTKMPSDDPA